MSIPNLEEIIAKYQRRQQNVILNTINQIMALFDRGATKAAVLAAKKKLVNNRFLPKDVRQAIDRIVTTINADVEKVIIKGIRQVWDISNEKNDVIAKTQSDGSGRRPPRSPRSSAPADYPAGDMFQKNFSAREAFIKRKDTGGKNKGLNLSKRVFKLSNLYKKVINDTILEGLKKGTSTRELAKDLRNNLRNDKVVDNPGTGVYKNPKKNAERLARNEINMAYANSDFERWNQQWFVIGIEIRLSNRHPKYDICDNLKGRYPKTFHFTLWHPNCLCIAIPILAPEEVMEAMSEYRLGINDKKPVVKYIGNMPGAATAWIKENAERINGWTNTPYWVEANTDFVTALLK